MNAFEIGVYTDLDDLFELDVNRKHAVYGLGLIFADELTKIITNLPDAHFDNPALEFEEPIHLTLSQETEHGENGVEDEGDGQQLVARSIVELNSILAQLREMREQQNEQMKSERKTNKKEKAAERLEAVRNNR
ncbi:MAG: hypothetical protein WDZ94_04790 [Patescibacteria group bacterium]